MGDYLGPYLLGPNDTEENGICCGDALACCSQIPSASIDAIITDPPYCAGAISEAARTSARGQGLRSETISRFGWFIGDNMGTGGLAFLLRALASEGMRIIKSTGGLLVFCDWRMQPILELAIESAGLRYQGLVVWNKGNMGLGLGFRHQHELIMHFTFGAPEYHDKGTPDVLTVSRVSIEDRKHQTQKPVELLSYLIRVVAPIGGIIIDPFAGSGSTCVAAKKMGRRYLAFEIDPMTCDLARERVRNTQSPLLMPEPTQTEMNL